MLLSADNFTIAIHLFARRPLHFHIHGRTMNIKSIFFDLTFVHAIGQHVDKYFFFLSDLRSTTSRYELTQ